ncbi:MAG: penicillin-binding protein activator LpoB [Treponema sp.]|jgi:hypothetical protein|nr:penicillin-binding protein activator LpoB [Treponema sp.]
MKKCVFFMVFCVLAAGFGFTQQITLDTAVRNGSAYLQGRLSRGSRVTVLAVSGGSPELAAYAMAALRSVLVNSGYFIVVERNEADLKVLGQEMIYQLSGDVSDETALSIGKQLGAEHLVSCSLARQGGEYRLELKAVQVETARIGGQWLSGAIHPDPAWTRLDRQEKSAALIFAGDELTAREQDVLSQGISSALDSHKVPLALDEEGVTAADGYTLTVTVYGRAAGIGNNLLQGEVSLKLNQGRRTLKQTGTYRITETNMSMLVQRSVERIQADKAFFQGVTDILNN